MLTLPIKKYWFDMIASEEKGEEYRSDNAYYFARFQKAEALRAEMWVCLRNGYRADSPKIYCRIRPQRRLGARSEWGGDPRKICWVLSILEVRAEGPFE